MVLAAAPLALSNPQKDAVTWPIWGGAFHLDEAVAVRASIENRGQKDAGVLLGMRSEPGADKDATVAVELISRKGAWTLRELHGSKSTQEIPVDAPAAAEFTVSFAKGGTSVKVKGGSKEVTLVPKGAIDPSAGVYVHLEPGAELDVRGLALNQPLPTHPELGTPLRKLAATKKVPMGTAADIWPPVHDMGFESMLVEQFDTMAPTDFYWATTRGEDEDFNFLPADLMVNYGTVHGMKLNGYFLTWDFELPKWVNAIAKTGDADKLGRVMDEHITTLVNRYKGRVHAWVVANEAIFGPDETGGHGAKFGDSIWTDVLGPEYIDRAFRTARAADPKAVLLYNETGAEGIDEKSDFLFKMAQDLVQKKVPIDGIGLQFHLDAAKLPPMADIRANIERLAGLGLDVYITELDVSLEGLHKKNPEAVNLKIQADAYASVAEICLSIARCRTFTVFGFSDKFGFDELGSASAPLMFDKDYKPKPAFFALQSALAK